jgi:hypothetical protein
MDVDDATVSNFAEAFLSVQEITQDLTEELSEAPTAEEAQSMQREARDERRISLAFRMSIRALSSNACCDAQNSGKTNPLAGCRFEPRPPPSIGSARYRDAAPVACSSHSR